jgi:hypothetical protein
VFYYNYPDKVIFDEVQFVPKLFHYIKMAKTLKQYQNHLKSNQKNSYYIIYQGKSLDHGNIKAINYGEYLSDLHN